MTAPDPELLAWLNSDDGEQWCRLNHAPVEFGQGTFAQVKEDDVLIGVPVAAPLSHALDDMILAEIKRYGMNGLPLYERRP